MLIHNTNLKFDGSFTKRKKTDSIILHHAAAVKCTVEDIHRWHLANDSNGVHWMGIGYHYFVRKDGSVWQGRPDDVVGAHAGTQNGYNTHSVGICFEGEYQEKDKVMPEAQFKAGEELIRYLLDKYTGCKILTHKDVSPTTDCPGKNFPVAKFKTLAMAPASPKVNPDLAILQKAGVMKSPVYWEANAKQGHTCKGEYVAELINNMAAYIKNND